MKVNIFSLFSSWLLSNEFQKYYIFIFFFEKKTDEIDPNYQKKKQIIFKKYQSNL